jgi:hypothetical protein
MLDKTIAKDIQLNDKYGGTVEKKSLLAMGQI